MIAARRADPEPQRRPVSGGALAGATPAPSFSPASRGQLQRSCSCGSSPGGTCEECAGAAGTLQRSVQASSSPGAAPGDRVPSIATDVLRSSGQPLEPADRRFMESRFAHDFSRVRVHADGHAAVAASAVQAAAFTVGNHLVFGNQQYAPRTSAGRRLLAHELTHVAQQGADASLVVAERVSSPDDRLEREAAVTAEAVLQRDRGDDG